MPGIGGIEFLLSGNLSQLRRDLNEAANLAKNTAGDINRSTAHASSGVAAMFKRTPERRAERAFAGLGTDIATGNLAGGISSFVERLTGLGLAAGIGVGVAIGFISKLGQELREADEAAAKLHSDLGKPLNVLSGLGPAEMTKQIETLTKAGEENAEKQQGWARKAQRFFAGPLGGSAAGMDIAAAKDAKDYAERTTALSRIRADAELEIANQKLKAVTSSEKDAALAKISADATEKRSKLMLERKDDPNLQKSIQAVTTEEKAARMEVEKKFKVKQDEAELEAKLLALKTSGLTPEAQKAQELRLRAAALQSQISGALKEDRPGLQNKLTPLQNQIAELPWEQKTTDEKVKSILDAKNKAKEDASIPAWRKRADDSMKQWRQNVRDDNRLRHAVVEGVDFQDFTDETLQQQDFSGGVREINQMGFKRTFNPKESPGTEASPWSDLGTGIDGIKSGIDLLNDKVEQYLS